MAETEKLKLALNLIKENKISLGIEVLTGSRNSYTLKVLGLLFCISGDFKKAYSIFFKLKDKEEKISEYLFFLEETIKNDYIPKYNHMIELIQKKQDSSEIEKILIELEKVSPNIDLYNIATLFYLSQSNIKMAHSYYIKLKEIDSSFKNNDKFEAFFKNKKMTKKLILNHSLQILLLGVIALFITKNLNLKENLNSKVKETINLEKKLEKITIEKEELIKSQEKNVVVVKPKEPLVKPNLIEEELFTNNELYNLALKRFKENKYNEVLKISEKVNSSQLPEYKAKELLFIKGLIYEKISQKKLSLNCYKEFLKKYNKSEYKDYINIVKQRITKLEKEM